MSRWPSWAPVPNKPTVSVDVKQHSTKLMFPTETATDEKTNIKLYGPKTFRVPMWTANYSRKCAPNHQGASDLTDGEEEKGKIRT